MILRKKPSLKISNISPEKMRLESIKKYQTCAKRNHIVSSRNGYTADIFCLHPRHFHLCTTQENRGISSRAERSLSQVLQWLRPVHIPPSPLRSL